MKEGPGDDNTGNSPDAQSLGSTIFGMTLVFGHWLVVLIATEALHRTLGTIPDWLYFLVCTALFFAILLVMMQVWKRVVPRPENQGPTLRGPDVLNRGYLRLSNMLESTNHPVRNWVIAAVVLLGSVQVVLQLWSYLLGEEAGPFDEVFRFMTSVFGTTIFLIMTASFIAGLVGKNSVED